MIKVAQKKFKDPKRQSLSERKENIFKAKKVWNSYLKEFRQQLKETQALINGRVEGKERIRIDEPLPEETVQLLSDLSSTLEKRVQEGNTIYQFQNKYSEDYKQFFAELEEKRLGKINGSPSGQISDQPRKEASFNAGLKKSAGIGPIRMFWESLKSFFSDDEGSRRATLLGQLRNLDTKLSDCELSLTQARTQENLSVIRKTIYECYLSVKYLSRTLEHAKRLSDKGFGIQSTETQEQFSTQDLQQKVREIAEDMVNPYTYFESNFLELKPDREKEEIRKLASKVKSNLYQISSDKYKQNIRLLSEVVENHKKLVSIAIGSQFSSFKDYERMSSRNADMIANQIIKLAESQPYDSFFSKIKKWLSGIGLKFNVFVSIRSNLMDAKKEVAEAREILNDSIDDLKENEEIDYQQINSNLNQLAEILYNISDNIDSISALTAKEQISEKQLQSALQSEDKGLFRRFIRKDRRGKT